MVAAIFILIGLMVLMVAGYILTDKFHKTALVSRKALQKAIEDDDTLERPMPPELLEMDRLRKVTPPRYAVRRKGAHHRTENFPLASYFEAMERAKKEKFLSGTLPESSAFISIWE